MAVDAHPYMRAMRAKITEVRHAALLLKLVKEPGLPMCDYADRLRVTKPVVSRGLRALEGLGLAVRKSTKEDRRVCLLFPTKQGRNVVATKEKLNGAKPRSRGGQNGRGRAGRV
jgi:DNA-binding MarR family transcriptional regulator